MKYFALTYDVVPDFGTRRTEFRQVHLTHVRAANERGELRLAGALGDPPDGALLVFRTESADVPEAFAQQDPYVISGLVSRWQVRPWTSSRSRVDRPESRLEDGGEILVRTRPPRHRSTYAKHFKEHVLPVLQKVDGYVTATVLQRGIGHSIEIVVITYWKSLEDDPRFRR